jgi:endonuclease G
MYRLHLIIFTLLLVACEADTPALLDDQEYANFEITLPPYFYEQINIDEIRKIYANGFRLWLDCGKKTAYQFRYSLNAQKTPSIDNNIFKLNPTHIDCQQTLAREYAVTRNYKRSSITAYIRGQLVPADHMHSSPKSIEQAHYMTNILPFHPVMSRGAWLQTQKIEQCYRNLATLDVYGGALWDTRKTNNYFKSSHNITTPSAYWKIIIYQGQIIAWVIPNNGEAYTHLLNRYLVKPQVLLRQLARLNVKPDIKDISGLKFNDKGWALPKGCYG